jgi:hypothetical protein
MAKCERCEYRVCAPCLSQPIGQANYSLHQASCKQAKEPNRRFLLAKASNLDSEKPVVQFLESKNIEAVPQRFEGKSKPRSIHQIWFPYLSGTIRKGTPVCFAYPVGNKVKILKGLATAQSQPSEVLIDIDGTIHKQKPEDLFLVKPRGPGTRRSASLKMKTEAGVDCGASVSVAWKPKQQHWVVVSCSTGHRGHPDGAGIRPLGARELEAIPEIVEGLEEMEAAQIPRKYIADIMEKRFGDKYHFQAQAINILANIKGKSSVNSRFPDT